MLLQRTCDYLKFNEKGNKDKFKIERLFWIK